MNELILFVLSVTRLSKWVQHYVSLKLVQNSAIDTRKFVHDPKSYIFNVTLYNIWRTVIITLEVTRARLVSTMH